MPRRYRQQDREDPDMTDTASIAATAAAVPARHGSADRLSPPRHQLSRL
jgi:hypothetical protein